MAQRRMFSLKIVDTDAFLEMPVSSQLLYFHLAMRADDDGFVSNPKKIMRFIGTQEDDLKILVAKRFILPFDSGVCVIKHWRIHNYIQSDRYTGTTYVEEKSRLRVKENGAYTECIQDVSSLETQVRLGKDRLGKDSVDTATQAVAVVAENKGVVDIIDAFKAVNPNADRWYANTTQRAAAARLIDTHGLEQVLSVVSLLPKSNTLPYIPTVTTPLQLEDKWASLAAALHKKKAEINSRKSLIPKI